MADEGMAALLERIRQAQGIHGYIRAQRLMENPLLRGVTKRFGPEAAEKIAGVASKALPRYTGIGGPQIAQRGLGAAGRLGGAVLKKAGPIGAALSVGKDVKDVWGAAGEYATLGNPFSMGEGFGHDYESELSPDAAEQIRQANAQAALRARLAEDGGGPQLPPAAMGPGTAAPRPSSPAQTEFVGPLPEQGGPMLQSLNDTSHLDALGVEPWKVDEWRKQAMAADQARGNTGPFRVRETGGPGMGAFSPGAPVPLVAGMDTQQYEEAFNKQSPAVQRLMQESRDRSMQDATQAATIDQALAQGQQARAGAGEQQARAAVLQRSARSLPEQVQEQQTAIMLTRDQVLKNNPLAQRQIEQAITDWMEQHRDAEPQEAANMLKYIQWTVADRMMPGILNLQQAVDPEFASAYARATGMMAGGGY